jgi:hypothetical protein
MPLDLIITAAIAGIIATYALLTLALWAPALKLPRLDFARAMANLTYSDSVEGTVPYRAGVAVIYMNGIFFSLLYAGAVAQFLPGAPIVKGTIWGIVLFVVSGLFFVPLFLKEGFFLNHVHKQAWATSLLVHGAWGMVVGWMVPAP